MKQLYRLLFILALGSGFAFAQTGMQKPPTTPPTLPSEQQPGMQNPDESTGQPASNTTVVKAQSDIQTALRRQLPASADSVTVSMTDDNKIKLSGTVSSETEKNQIEQIARSAAPDVKIENKLTVSGGAGTVPPGGSSGGISPTASPEKPPVNPEDKTGTERPRQQEKPPMGNSFMAQSSGQNPSSQYPGSQTPGTTPSTPPPSSDNKADTSTPAATGSADAQGNIQKALQQDPNLANANIAVNVSGNKVELTGTVASKEQKKTAKQIAESNAGGMKVVDHLKVQHASKESKDNTSNPPKY